MKKIKTSEDLLFNYFLKSRNKIEIQKRIDYLVKIIEKEYNPNTTNEKGSWKKNKENKEKLEEDNSIMVSNFSKVSSTNKKFKKNGKDKIKGVNTNSKFEDSSNKNLGNNIQLDEDEEEENDENNFEKEKSNNNSNKKVKIEDSSNNVAKVIEDNEAEKGKKDLEEDMEME